MNKEKADVITSILALVVVGSLLFLSTVATNNLAFAGYGNKDKKDENKAKTESKFNEADFKIKDFGIKDGNPWLSVEGTAGGSTPENESLIYAYAFVTDNGTTFAATSHGGEDSAEVANDTQWHTHEVKLDEKNCVASINDNGKNELSKDKITITETNATKVDGVKTAELTKNTDGTTCVTKVFDSAP